MISLDIFINLGFVVYDLVKKFKKLYRKLKLKYEIRKRKKQGMPFDDLLEEQKKLDERPSTTRRTATASQAKRQRIDKFSRERSQPRTRVSTTNQNMHSTFNLLVD